MCKLWVCTYLVGKPIVCMSSKYNNVYMRIRIVHSAYTVYQETLMKGKFNEFDESGSNCQTNATQN